MPISQASLRNRLLAALSADAFALLHKDLSYVPLRAGQSLERANERIDEVYFIEDGMAAIVATTAGAEERTEVGVVGAEGMSGVAVVHGSDRSPHEMLMPLAGTALRIKSDDLRRCLAALPELHRVCLRYAHVQAVQHAHAALASARYDIGHRLARWLLMCHDRIKGNEIAMTHEFLALMLGVRRAGVTVALHELEGSKVVRTARGRVLITDRAKLESFAGSCYGAPEAEYARILGTAPAPPRAATPN